MTVVHIMELLWIWILFFGCSAQMPPEEVELFNSVKQTELQWASEPRNAWDLQYTLRLNSERYRISQACLTGSRRRTLLSPWIERANAHQLLLDIQFALGKEPSDQVKPLGVHLFTSERPLARFSSRVPEVLSLLATDPFPPSVRHHHIEPYVSRNLSLTLGSVIERGFHLGFSYSGTCAFIVSVRLYYRRCPGFVAGLARFAGAVAGSGEPQQGSCVDGATIVLSLPPEAHCLVDGVWGQLDGECVCAPGHERADETCTACRMGYYKPANESGGCRQCPPKSSTEQEGAEKCDCQDGYDRLHSDPHRQGCTRPPSAPVNVMVHHHSNSLLSVRWEPPRDFGGREAEEVTYSIMCSEKQGEASGHRWEACKEDVVFLPSSVGLTTTEVNVTGLRGLHDYRLSVGATNALSTRQGGRSSVEATVNVHAWKVPVIVTVSPASNISEPRSTSVLVEFRTNPQKETISLSWSIIGGLLGSLLLLALALTVVFSLRCAVTKQTPDQEVELMPWNPSVTFLPPQEPPQSRPELGSVVLHEFQWLGAHDDPLLDNLRDTLVERSRLTLGKELGKGEFGLVYEGILTSEEGVDVKVAVKTIRGIHRQEDLHEFIKEAEIMKSFDHDNVVRLLGVALEREEDSSLSVPLVILPFMKHGDLRCFLIATRYKDVPIFVPYQSLLRFMVDIAAGMEYLSSKGFIHRDLAARNCMLGDSHRVCVADFGLSKKINSSNYYRQKAAIRVPIKWMAIESLSESVYTTKSDVWSFGVTMWEIVSRGRTPYPGVHNHELLDLLTGGQRLKKPEDCDAKLYEAMQTCWHCAPAQRPGFAELGSRLKELLSLLPPLEAFEETHYINQGLEAAAWHCTPKPGCDDAEEMEEMAPGNDYTHAPFLPAQRNDVEEDGYLLSNTIGLALERNHKS